MSNFALSIHRPKFILTPLMFGVIYAIGIPVFIFLWSGQQSIPGFAGFEQYGLAYAITCLLGAICNFAILWGYRWGAIGQIGVWVANLVMNVALQRAIEPYFGLALFLVCFWIFDVYRNRQWLG